ncbi:MAG: hypothetical protein ABR503_09020 [Chitinophagaceae bacterium]
MDKYGNNGHALELAQFETPFADVVQREDTSQQVSTENFYDNYMLEAESPFSKTYETAFESSGIPPEGEDFVDFLAELNDSEFDNTLYELATEAEDSWSNKISSEVAMGSNYIPFATKHARDYFEPVALEAEAMIDRVAEHFSGNNMADYSEKEIESFFTELPFNHAQFSPAQEQFLGSVFKKVKSVVKKGVDLAKKGISAVGKLLPINLVLKKIKALVRPLLEKVLKFAIGKLPKNLQPHAQTLAKKFLNLETSVESESNSMQGEEELGAIQTELDGHLTQLVFSPNDNEADILVNEYGTSFETIERSNNYETAGINLPSLNEARQQFINEMKNLQPGESPAPAIERFLPAAILALQPVIKIAISIIGRQKVINFLAGLLSKLVQKYIPANVAQPLAASIIDVGMSAIGFETYETHKPDVAYETIANTIEETVQNMNELNEVVLNDQETMTMHLLEAFEKAAANNFPPQYIREELRPSKQRGSWVSMPRTGPAALYKKFTHVFDTTIDAQSAAAITTFRGLPLTNFLKDKLGLDPSKPIQAKVHLFEATRNTRLSRISKYEKLPGLNKSQPYSWVQLHPLTKKASLLLLKEPALGKDVAARFIQARYRTQPGQRFYYLEISGARLRIPQVNHGKLRYTEGGAPSTARPSQSGDIQGVINFIKSEIRLNYYFSEEDAKTLVEKLNKNDFLGAAQSIRHSVKNVLNDMLLKNITTKVKIVHEAFPELYLENYEERIEQFSLAGAIGRIAGKEVISKLVEKLVEKISDMAYQSLGNYFKARAAEFKEAQAQPQDGVTVKISWKNIQGMAAIKAVINAVKGNLSLGNLSNLSLPNISAPEIQVVADKKFD